MLNCYTLFTLLTFTLLGLGCGFKLAWYVQIENPDDTRDVS